MALLPAGTQLPPLPHAVALLVGALVVAAGLRRARPAVDDRAILALAPWMVLGAVAYVAYQLDLVPSVIAPFAGSPTVYATAAVLAGATWLVAGRLSETPGAARATLGGVGAVGAVFLVALVVGFGLRRGTLTLHWPLMALVIASALAAAAWGILVSVAPETVDTAGAAGPLVLFAHALDGVSTAVGYDVLGFGERSPLSRAIIEFAATLPTADLLGAGWLFVVVKLALAAVALWLLVGYVAEAPGEGYALLGFVAAVGLGPGAHNLLLFAVVDPAPAATVAPAIGGIGGALAAGFAALGGSASLAAVPILGRHAD